MRVSVMETVCWNLEGMGFHLYRSADWSVWDSRERSGRMSGRGVRGDCVLLIGGGGGGRGTGRLRAGVAVLVVCSISVMCRCNCIGGV